MVSNLKLNKYLIFPLGIIFVLSIMVIYQANTMNKIKENQKSKSFLETKLERDQSTAKTLFSLKALIDDKNISKECKVTAALKYLKIVTAANYESEIELLLQNEGYDDVVSFITDDRVRIILKEDKKLSNNQLEKIKNIVMNVAKISDIEVVLK